MYVCMYINIDTLRDARLGMEFEQSGSAGGQHTNSR